MKNLIASLTEMGIIASPDAIYLLSEQERPLEIVHEILAGRGELLFLDKKDIIQTIEFMNPQTIPATGSMLNGNAMIWEQEVVLSTPVGESANCGTINGHKQTIRSREARNTPFRDRDGKPGDPMDPAGPEPSQPHTVGMNNQTNPMGGNSSQPHTVVPNHQGEPGLRVSTPTHEESGKGPSIGPPRKIHPPGVNSPCDFRARSESGPSGLVDHVVRSDGETISLTKPFILPGAVDRYRPVAAEYQDDIVILGDITGKSLCEGKISDFSKYFLDRLTRLRDLIKTRPEMMHAVPIERMRSKSGEGATVGIVTSVRNGDRGLSFDIEDEGSSLNVFIPKNGNEKFLKEVGTILNDEVIGVIGSVRMSQKGHGPSIIPEKIVRPPIPYRHTPSPALEEVSVAFVSDLHMGSKTFLGTEWKRAMAFLSGKNHETREVASRIKYLVFTGDVVDGIGVYPGHEEDLDITDIFLQYHAIADDLNSLPDHIKVIIQPGNHDGVRKAEPQPSLPGDIQKLFDPGRVIFAGNPSTLALHGVNILAYHGGGMDDIIPAIPGLTYENPIGAMKEMMARRHLAPIYGGKTPLAPEHRDYLLMESIPDVFVTGHVHTTQVDSFHNVLLINASCWMAQTAYQKMRDFVPDPAKLPVVRLDALKPTLVHFAE